jgi:hypothetical protein
LRKGRDKGGKKSPESSPKWAFNALFGLTFAAALA